VRLVLVAVLFFLSPWPARAEERPSLLQILAQELDRNFTVLKEKADPPPYYLAYAVTEQDGSVLAASQGALLDSSARRHRILDITLRVGSPQLDNYHPSRGEEPRFTPGAMIPLDDSSPAIRQRVWLETDRVYRLAAQRLIKIRTDQQVKIAGEGDPGDFSTVEPSVHHETSPPLRLDTEAWAGRLRKLSIALGAAPGIILSRLSLATQREIKYFVNTEGTRLQHGRLHARLQIAAGAKAPDGMDITLSESFDAPDPAALPGDDVVLRAIQRLTGHLVALSNAPLVEPYVGPAILSGRAAGVFFHEIFGHRVEGHRLKDEADGQTFAQSVGSKVLPEFLSVTYDPTLRNAGDTWLAGAYFYDDEGVKARRVLLVEEGILKTFLMSRSPVLGIPHSNGHGRREPGREVVSRQSNLIVESANQVPESRLREMLIEEARKQGKPYGLCFMEVTGGYTLTARRGIQAYKVIPLVVFKVYPDGRPDELVRGADIVGTPLASFGKILATGDRLEIFNGYCGAESGSVPVSAVSPALLVSELEVQRKESSQERPPLLPRPPRTGGSE